LEIEQQVTPRLRALTQAIGEAYQFLLTLRRRTDDHENALRLVLQPRFQVDAVDPEVNIALRREITLLPALVLIGPHVLEPRNRRRRQTGRILADQCSQHLLKVAGRDALEIEDRNQHLQALGAPRVRRQDGWIEPNALGGTGLAIADAGLADCHRTYAGHDLAFRHMPV